MAEATPLPIHVRPVDSAADLDAFIRVPWPIYAEDPNWVPPLLFERRQYLNPKKNPYFEHADVQFWLAEREGQPVGRISAQVNHAHLACHDDATGHFGMLEGNDDPEIFTALFETAMAWLRERGMKRVVGPFSLSINDESGLLIEGFETPPSLMMGHARPYYASHLEAAGFTKAKDLICYRYDFDTVVHRSGTGIVRKFRDSAKFTVRPLNMRRFNDELGKIMTVFNDAWANNWGFVPMTPAEVRHLGQNLKMMIRPKAVGIAEIDGTPVAMAVGLPNLSEVIADLNGRLLPFGWLKLLWRLKIATPKTSRIALMGVSQRYQNTPLGAALAFSVIDAFRANQKAQGVESCEASWILEDNMPMRRIIERFGGIAYKTYRLYERPLDR